MNPLTRCQKLTSFRDQLLWVKPLRTEVNITTINGDRFPLSRVDLIKWRVFFFSLRSNYVGYLIHVAIRSKTLVGCLWHMHCILALKPFKKTWQNKRNSIALRTKIKKNIFVLVLFSFVLVLKFTLPCLLHMSSKKFVSGHFETGDKEMIFLHESIGRFSHGFFSNYQDNFDKFFFFMYRVSSV